MAKAAVYEARTEEEIDLRSAVKEADRELDGVRRQLNTAFKAFEQLEASAHQNQFRQGVRNGRRAHHAVAAAD